MKLHVTILLVLALAACLPASAQKMSPAEYQSFLKKLNADVTVWQKVFSALQVEDLPVSYAVGKLIADNKGVALTNLEVMDSLIKSELFKPQLSNQISMAKSLTDIMSSLSDTEGLLPAGAARKNWDDSGMPVLKGVSEYDQLLEKHVFSFADELQERAERCSR
ncbi:MAG TPA: hypothetical protein VII95_18840 [Terriglobales bacterium]